MALLAVLCFCAGAYAVLMRSRIESSRLRLQAVERSASDVLEGVRILTAASRESSGAVLTALDRALRVLEGALDAVLIFTPDGENLVCTFASGPRAERYDALRMRRDDAASLPARAALCGHRVGPGGDLRVLIPTDADALAVPMIAAERLVAVVYISSTSGRIGNADAVVRCIAQAAAPYALAAEREADRASATYDALTGLHTPRAFRQKLQEEIAMAGLTRQNALSLWFIDTDRFKIVNDTFGHGAGDVVLSRMAALLREHTITGVDLAARNGGDEFCAILRNAEKLAAIERAQRLCEAVRAFDFGFDLRITASIGVAAFPYDAASANELLEVADAAMYHSKRSGRDRVSFSSGDGAFAVYC